MTHRHSRTTRQLALRRVEQIRQATGRYRGAAAAAADELGLNRSTVTKWVRIADDEYRAQQVSAALADHFVLSGLLRCGSCQRPMNCGRAPAAGTRIYRCPGCHAAVDAEVVERAVGRALLLQVPRALRALGTADSPEQAVRSGRVLLQHVTVGCGPRDIRLTWRTRAPARSPSPPSGEDVARDRDCHRPDTAPDAAA